MNNFRDASAASGVIARRGPQGQNSLSVNGQPLAGSGVGVAQPITYTFPYQSFLDDTLQERALAPQSVNNLIVNEKYTPLQTSIVTGYAVGLHPSSETPIAIRFKKGEQDGDSPVFYLKPGQVVRPQGLSPGGGRFSGFDWGIPQGWLGGGTATLVVLRAADADVEWATWNELMFHRLRLQIIDPAAFNPIVGTPGYANWPAKFPWQSAVTGQGGFVRDQGGPAVMAVNPTRVEMRLRKSADLLAPADMRIIQYGSEQFDQDQFGVVPAITDQDGYDVTWGTWANLATGSGLPQFQVQRFDSNLSFVKVPSYVGGIALVSANPNLIGEYVDIYRYGML